MAIDYDWNGVIAFLQKEYREVQIRESEQELEKKELKEQILKLEAEQEAYKQMYCDLIKRIQMLEHCLREERKQGSSQQNNSKVQNYESIDQMDLLKPKQKQEPKDNQFRMEDNQDVIKYLQEIGLDDVYNQQNEEIQTESNTSKSQYEELEHVHTVYHMDSVRNLQIVEVDDQQVLVSMGDDCLVGLWNMQNPSKMEQLNVLREHNGPIFRSAVYNKSEKCILFTAGLEGVIKAWDMQQSIKGDCRQNSLYGFQVHDNSIWDLQVDDQKNQLLSCGSDCLINVYDVGYERLELLTEINLKEMFDKEIMGTCMLVEDSNIMVGCYQQNILLTFDRQKCVLKNVIEFPSDCQYDQINRMSRLDGLIVAGCEDGNVRLFDPLSNQMVKQMKTHSQSVSDLIVDENHLVTSSHDGDMKYWDMNTFQCQYKLQSNVHKYDDSIFAIKYSQDQSHLLVGSADGSIKVYLNNL